MRKAIRRRAIRWRAITASVAGAVTLSVSVADGVHLGARDASAFGNDGLSSLHARITRNALTFLDGSVLDTVVDGNLDEDQDAAADLAERHAQNCRFVDGARYVNDRYRQVIDALHKPWKDDPKRAKRLFGHILHGVQDLYSHSNWIPTPPEGLGIRGRLIETSLGFWTYPAAYQLLFDDVMLIEGDAPSGVSVRLPTDSSGRVSSAVPVILDRRSLVHAPIGDGQFSTAKLPTPGALRPGVNAPPVARAPAVRDPVVRDPGVGKPPIAAPITERRYRGFMTSGAPRHPGDQHCPLVAESCDVSSAENVCLRHGDKRSEGSSRKTYQGAGSLNLDGGGDGDWFEARHHAKLQTRHEWCRLLHLSRAIEPSYAAAGRALGTWVKASDSPHPAGTPCATGPRRAHSIEITVTPGKNAPEAKLAFTLFRNDFTDSRRTTAARGSATQLKLCANSGDTVVAVLLSQQRAVPLSVPVTAEARSWTVRDRRVGFDVSYTIKITPDSC